MRCVRCKLPLEATESYRDDGVCYSCRMDEEAGSVEEAINRRIRKVEDEEELEWLRSLREGVRKQEWKNVAWRMWVLTELNEAYASLAHTIDRYYGDEIREAKADE